VLRKPGLVLIKDMKMKIYSLAGLSVIDNVKHKMIISLFYG
jgi:hypothetical protein